MNGVSFVFVVGSPAKPRFDRKSEFWRLVIGPFAFWLIFGDFEKVLDHGVQLAEQVTSMEKRCSETSQSLISERNKNERLNNDWLKLVNENKQLSEQVYRVVNERSALAQKVKDKENELIHATLEMFDLECKLKKAKAKKRAKIKKKN